MNPTTEKINVSQTDYNNLADWAKPDYQSTSPNTVASAVPLRDPQPTISVDALQPTGAVKIPKVQTTDTTSAGVIAGTKAIPQGWDAVTYANFKQANPDLEPDAQDTQNMLNAGNYQPNISSALTNFNQAQQATGTVAQDERSKLNALAASIFGEKASAQANQVNLERQAGLDEQMKVRAEINTEMANEQLRLRGEEEKIRQGYGTEAQKQISRQTLNDTYGRRLADLSIRQSAANQNITSIQENAERQTKLLTAPLDTKITYLSTFAKDNVDYLDKKQSEKLAFIVDDLKTQKQGIKELQDAKTQMIMELSNNGGGTNTALIKQIQDAKDIGSVTALGASTGLIGKLDREAKLANIAQSRASTSKIYADMEESRAKAEAEVMGLTKLSPEDNARLNATPEAKTINDGAKFYNALDAYKREIEKSGTGEWIGADAGALSSAYQSVVGAVKDYYTLGTLDNGVEKLIGLGIPKPSVWGLKGNRIGGIDEQLNIVATNLKQSTDQLAKTGYANSVEAQGLIGKATGIVKSRQDPLGAFMAEDSNTTSTDPLKIN